MKGFHSQRKTSQYLLLAYCIFIVYGCFIPFHFNFDPNFLRWRWQVFLLESTEHIPLSLADFVSNILLFVPFGILCVWQKLVTAAVPRPLLHISIVTLCGLLFGAAIEAGQTLAPWRKPSAIDALCNGAGALIGAISGRVLFRRFAGSVETVVSRICRRRPSSLVLAYVLLGIAIDSFYPFAVTLDVSAIWQNVKHSEFLPFARGPHRSWLDLFVQKGVMFAAIGYLMSLNLRHLKGGRRASLIWLYCIGLAVSLEAGKLIFGGRAFYSANVIISSCGALAGVLLYSRVTFPLSLRSRPQTIYLVIIVALLVYFEMSPGDWIGPNELPGRLSRIEWLPFKSYYSAEPLAALFDLQTKIYFFAPLGFVMMMLNPIQRAAYPRRQALLACLLIALALEALQILVRSRIPSMTDLFIFVGSAWIGIALCENLRGRALMIDRPIKLEHTSR